MKLTDEQEREFEQSNLRAKGDQISELLNGTSFSDALGLGLSVVCTSARCMKLTKIEVQKMLIEMWDAVSQEEIEALQRTIAAEKAPAGGKP